MSYSFDGTNDVLSGTLTTPIANVPMTVAAWVKCATHPLAQDAIVQIGGTAGSNNDSVYLCLTSASNTFGGQKFNSTGTASSTAVAAAGTFNNTWIPAVYVITSATLRDLYVESISNTAQTTLSRTSANVDLITVGERLPGDQDFTGLIAEVAVWDAALTTQEITDYLAGVSASIIAPSNLRGYWPLSASNATQANEGLDSGGDLTVTSATYSSDHPTITFGGAAKQMRNYQTQVWG